MSKTTTMIQTEWIDAILDVIRFVLHHTTLEYDGAAHMTHVHYRGPRGWVISSSIHHNTMANAPPGTFQNEFSDPGRSQETCLMNEEENND